VTAPILPGAEPYSAAGDERGALVLHGFTGNPQSMRGLATALAAAGLTVELPLLPGHGTAVADLVPTGWDDWSAAAEAAYVDLAARCTSVVVVGLSMGGTLSVWLAERHPEIAALVLVNPLVVPPDAETVAFIDSLIVDGDELAPGVGSDIALPGASEAAYSELPLRSARTLFDAAAAVERGLGSVSCPVLLFSSVVDHVVDPVSGECLAERVAGPVERVRLERSYHVATLDYDKDEIERRTVAFVTGRLARAPIRPLSRDDVVHVARLARLSLSPDEVDLFTAQLRTVLEHAADVAALDLAHLAPTAHPLPVVNVVRADDPRPSLDRREVLAAAPSVEDDRFRVPRIGGEAP
jgi:carboxylesterase